jgi:hypothetical protein
MGMLDRGHDNQYLKRSIDNGSFQESFDALATSDGATVTLSLEQSGGGDMTMQFSDGLFVLDTTPAITIALTAGSDTSPQKNYVYIPQATKVLTKSTSGFPTDAEHIKIGFFYVPSATYVQTEGVYINNNHNDHLTDSNDMGHMLHLAERARIGGGIYFSGIDPNGTDQAAATSYLNYISGSESYFKMTSGVMYQMHRHPIPAFDSSTSDDIHVVNWSGEAFHKMSNLADIVADSTGTTLANKYFNVFFFAVGNKGGEYAPIMAMLSSGSYSSQVSAENDVDSYDNTTMPREFAIDSATGVPICRMTLRWSGGTSTLTHISTKDLRREGVGGGGSSTGGSSEFADNQFNVFNVTDITKIMDFDISGVTTGNTRTMTIPDGDGTLGLFTGLAGGQTIYGGTAASENLTLYSTTDATKGQIDVMDDLDLNNKSLLNTEWIDFNLTPTVTGQEGRMYWNADDGTLNLGMPGGKVNLQMGQEMVVRSRNETGATILNGSVVYISGASGNKPLLTLADADTEATSSKTIGFATEDIAHNDNGYITTQGYVRGDATQPIDTSAFTEGDSLWLSSTAGEFTGTIPASPKHAVFLGYVIRSHASEGEIYVKIMNGFEITELHDVLITSVADNDVLQYNSSSTIWENIAFSTFVGTIDHDVLLNFVANEHIDWTNASNDFKTSGSGEFTGDVGIGLVPDVLYGLKTNKDIRTSGKVWSDQTLRTNAIQPQSSGSDLKFYTIGTRTFSFLPGGVEKVTIALDGTISSLGSLSDGTTSVNITEIVDFFNATDITGAQAETLTDTSNADSLHVHADAGITLNFGELDDVTYTTHAAGDIFYSNGSAVIHLTKPSVNSQLTMSGAGVPSWTAFPIDQNNKVGVDSGATADFLGATGGTGVLRTDSSFSFTDGGNFVTLGIDLSSANTWTADVTTTGDFVVGSYKYGNAGVSVPSNNQAFHASAAPNAGMTFMTTGGNRLTMTDTASVEFFQARLNSNIVLGATSALGTTATNGFPYIPTMAGTPTGTPTSFTGKVPMVYDTSNNKLYVYNSGWKGVTLA